MISYLFCFTLSHVSDAATDFVPDLGLVRTWEIDSSTSVGAGKYWLTGSDCGSHGHSLVEICAVRFGTGPVHPHP